MQQSALNEVRTKFQVRPWRTCITACVVACMSSKHHLPVRRQQTPTAGSYQLLLTSQLSAALCAHVGKHTEPLLCCSSMLH